MLVSTRKDPLVGRILKGVYRIDQLMAEGSMSRVYRAEHMGTKGQIVIKTLRPWFNDVDFIRSFLRSANLYSQIKHPNVVGVFDSGRLDDLVYVAMDYMSGSALTDIVGHKGLSLTDVLWIMEQVCSGVDAAHKLNILHRDIKPGNIIASGLSGDENVAKVADFCIGRPLSDENIENTHNGMAKGLPGFISPEQISGARDVDVRADVYALGAILYYMVAGKQPYGDDNPDTIMQKQQSVPPDRLLVIQLADPNTWKLQAVISKAMAVDRNERYPSVMALWHDILKQLGKEPPLKTSAQTMSQPADPKYMFIFKGELEEGTDTNKAKMALQTILNLDSKKIEKLMAQDRVVIRNNISFNDAKRFSDLFKIAGAVGHIEKVGDGTHTDKAENNTAEKTAPSTNLESLNLAQDNPQTEISTQAHSHHPSSAEAIPCEFASAESEVSENVSSELVSPEPASAPIASSPSVATEPELAQPGDIQLNDSGAQSIRSVSPEAKPTKAVLSELKATQSSPPSASAIEVEEAEPNLIDSQQEESLLPENKLTEGTLVKANFADRSFSHSDIDEFVERKITALNLKNSQPTESKLSEGESTQAVLAETEVGQASSTDSNVTEPNTIVADVTDSVSEVVEPEAEPPLAVAAETEAAPPSDTHTDLTEPDAVETSLNEELPENSQLPEAESQRAVLAEPELAQASSIDGNVSESNTKEADVTGHVNEVLEPETKPPLAVAEETEAVTPSVTHTDLTEQNVVETRLSGVLPENSQIPGIESQQAVLADTEVTQPSPTENAGSTQFNEPQFNTFQPQIEIANASQTNSTTANSIQRKSIQRGEHKKNSSLISKSTKHKQRSNISVSSLTFYSSSFAVAGIEQESVEGKSINQSPSLSKRYIYALAIIVLLSTIGLAWPTPILQPILERLANLL